MFFVIGRKKLAAVCAGTAAFLALGCGIGGLVPDIKTFGYGSEKIVTVLVDAGHGAPDGGTVGVNGSVESDINLEIAEKLCEVLNGKGINTMMTRTGSEGITKEEGGEWSKKEDMQMRLQMIKKSGADLLVTIHMNHFTQSDVHGLRLFYSQNHPEIKPLAENMQKRMSEVTGAKISTVRTADKGLFLMKSPVMPAILVECGFLSNPKEEKNLNTEEYQAKLAWAIAESIEAYF